MPRDRVSFRIGPSAPHDTDAFFNSGFQVYYKGDASTVEFIELARDSGFKALYGGVDVFASQAEELVERIAQDSPFDPEDPFIGYSYIFPDLELSLWRPVVPASPDDDEGQHFSWIGIGVRGYYSTQAL
jgi:hypothetical protein